MRLAVVGWTASVGAHATGGALALWALQAASPSGRVLLPRPIDARHTAAILPPRPPEIDSPAAASTLPKSRPATNVFSGSPGDSNSAQVLPPGGDAGRSLTAAEAPAGTGRIGPRFASGKLWVRPQVTVRATGTVARSHAQLVDRAVRAMLGTYVDSMRLEADQRARDGHWGTKDFGIDSKWITVGGVKIPSALLGLLPVNLPAPSIDQVQDAQRLADMRADIYRAAASAQDYNDFKKTLREIRERADAAREFERNSRLPMPPLPVDTSTR